MNIAEVQVAPPAAVPDPGRLVRLAELLRATAQVLSGERWLKAIPVLARVAPEAVVAALSAKLS
jgi:hypothetical protein